MSRDQIKEILSGMTKDELEDLYFYTKAELQERENEGN